MNATWYTETQRFTQWWLWLILLLPTAVFISGIIQQLFMGVPFGDNPAPDIGLIASGLVPLAVLILFRFLKLTTIIDASGIRVQFYPFVNKFFSWEEVDQIYVRKYNALLEYGGWGVRFGRNGTAYNVAGNQGLQLVLKNGKRLLIGTQDADHLRRVLANHRKTDGAAQ